MFLSILSGFINSGSHFWSNMIWSGSRLNFCQSLLGPHVSFERFSFNRINLVKPFHKSDKLLFESKFQVIIDTFLLQNVQMNTSNLVPSIYLLNRECFFLRHKELNSRFIVMTTGEVTLDRPKVGTGFSVICQFCWLRFSRFTLKFSTGIFAPYGLFAPLCGFSYPLLLGI